MAGVVLRENINMGCGQENIHFSVQLNNIWDVVFGFCLNVSLLERKISPIFSIEHCASYKKKVRSIIISAIMADC